MPLHAVAPYGRFIFAANAGSTLALFGLIWFVQLVHYPLFARIAPADFTAFEAEHATRTGWIAAPLMILELITSFLLLDRHLSVRSLTPAMAYAGAALTIATWLSTFLVQVPLHNGLHRAHDPKAIRRLVSTNWLRTAAWTARAALVLYWITQS